MANAEFTVTNRRAARQACQPGIARIAGSIRAAAAARTPVRTGTLKGGWRTEQGTDPATTFVTNPVRYARFVEYGTRKMRARPMLGPVTARYRR